METNLLKETLKLLLSGRPLTPSLARAAKESTSIMITLDPGESPTSVQLTVMELRSRHSQEIVHYVAGSVDVTTLQSLKSQADCP
jgi:hypothetical protein